MSDYAERIVQKLGTYYFEAGIAAGITWANTQCEAESRRQGLVVFLEKLIGPVPEALRARIFAADLACLRDWYDHTIVVTDFESVFNHPTKAPDSTAQSSGIMSGSD